MIYELMTNSNPLKHQRQRISLLRTVKDSVIKVLRAEDVSSMDEVINSLWLRDIHYSKTLVLIACYHTYAFDAKK